MIEIKRWTDGKVLYTAENAQDVRAALEEAVVVGARLDGARLVGARLDRARLVGASLDGASLDGASLVGARLDGARFDRARLDGARLVGASLYRASLVGASLDGDVGDPAHPLHAFRADMWSILDQAPNEVPALISALEEGRVNGSVYSDGECGCLSGTLGICRAGSGDGDAVSAALAEMGIKQDSSRPAEQWFISIPLGAAPLPLDTEQWPSEGVFRASHALAWAKEWTESRSRIAAALTGGEAADAS